MSYWPLRISSRNLSSARATAHRSGDWVDGHASRRIASQPSASRLDLFRGARSPSRSRRALWSPGSALWSPARRRSRRSAQVAPLDATRAARRNSPRSAQVAPLGATRPARCRSRRSAQVAPLDAGRATRCRSRRSTAPRGSSLTDCEGALPRCGARQRARPLLGGARSAERGARGRESSRP